MSAELVARIRRALVSVPLRGRTKADDEATLAELAAADIRRMRAAISESLPLLRSAACGWVSCRGIDGDLVQPRCGKCKAARAMLDSIAIAIPPTEDEKTKKD